MLEEKTKGGKIFDRKVLKDLFLFVKPYQRGFYWLVILTIFLAIIGPLRPFLIQYTIDKYIKLENRELLIGMSIFLIFLIIVQAVGEYAHSYLSGYVGQNVIRDMRVKLFEHLMRFRLKFYDNTPVGRLITRNVSDMETIADIFSEGIAAIIGDVLQIVIILGFMFFTNWKLTIVSMSLLPILLFSTYVFKEKVKVSFNEVRTAVSNLNTFLQEHITGMNIVQIFSAESREYKKFIKINEEHKKANIKSIWYYSVYFPVAEVIAAASTGLLVWYGAREVLHAQVTEGVLVAFIMYIAMFFRPIRMIADRFNTLQMGIVSADRVLKLLQNNEEIVRNGTYQVQSLRGEVEFNNVSFAYNEEDYILKDISFIAQSGKMTAFVGATGAGKSSIINLVNRFYDIQKGKILIDQKDIYDYDVNNLRKHIGIVLQDVFLFTGSIYENITLGNKSITRHQVEKAVELVGADKFINQLPGRLDYDVMERGATLSVGQRQLLSFVRAMVYDPKILVLDEATSSVDTETEELIQNAINKMMYGRTSLVIAHRLSTIQMADQIIVLNKGEIKEKGKHDELIELNGFYKQLHQMQYKSIVA